MNRASGGLVASKQRTRRLVAAVLAEVGAAHERAVEAHAGVLERGAVAVEALVGRRQPARAEHAADTAVAPLEQVRGGVPAAADVVDEDGVDAAVVGATVDGDDRDALAREAVEVRVARRGDGDDDAGHPLADGDVDVPGLLGDVLIGVAQHEAVAVGVGDVLDAAHDGCEEGVLDVGDDDRPDADLLAAQGLSRTERLVVELGDGPPDAFRLLR